MSDDEFEQRGDSRKSAAMKNAGKMRFGEKTAKALILEKKQSQKSKQDEADREKAEKDAELQKEKLLEDLKMCKPSQRSKKLKKLAEDL